MAGWQEIVDEILRSPHKVGGLRAWVGFDGTVDNIVDAVGNRQGLGEVYTPIPTISDFGRRISSAAGLSTNIELFLKRQKVGGNAAIMAGALANAGVRTELVATLGRKGNLHPVFAELAKKARLTTLGEPSQTHAVEFADGKVMLGYTRNLEAVTFTNLQNTLGKRRLKDELEKADIVSLLNWTMIPAMTEILRSLTATLLPEIPEGKERVFFFDLSDPQKRSEGQLGEVLKLLKSFAPWGRVVLGMNQKEAGHCARAVGLKEPAGDSHSILLAAQGLRETLGVDTVVIHTTDAAACATDEGEYWQGGPHLTTIKIRTGAGDHFNAGFAIGEALGVPPLVRLTLGVASSGFYVGEGRTGNWDEILGMIKKGW